MPHKMGKKMPTKQPRDPRPRRQKKKKKKVKKQQANLCQKRNG